MCKRIFHQFGIADKRCFELFFRLQIMYGIQSTLHDIIQGSTKKKYLAFDFNEFEFFYIF